MARIIAIGALAVMLCAALLMPLHAFAQTACFSYAYTAVGSQTFTSPGPACTDGFRQLQGSSTTTVYQFLFYSASNNICEGQRTIGTAAPTRSAFNPVKTSVACPPQDPICGPLAALATPTYVSVPGTAAPGGSTCSPTGCSMTFSGTVIRVTNPEGVKVTEGDATFTGSACTPDPTATATPDVCPGGSAGEVNGVTVCVEYDPELNVIESVKPVADSTNTFDSSNATSTATTTTGTETTTCKGSVCTTTKTTTTGTVTKTEVEKQDRDDFCTLNPRVPLCVDRRISSSCGAFSCEGDAIDCEIARKAQDSACKLFNNIDAVGAVGLAAANSVYEPSDVETTSLSFSSAIDQTDRLASACPGDLTLQVASATVVLPFSKLCGSLQLLGNLAVGLSLLAAAFIVFRGN